MSRVAILVVLVSASSASADEGEVMLSPYIQPEVAWVSHPITKAALPFEPSSSFTVLPRVGAAGRFGLTNALTLGLGLDGSAIPGLVAKGVTIENTKGDLATGTRVDLMLPATLAYRFETGSDFSAAVELSAGPQLVGWLANRALNPDLLGEGGLPTELPITIADTWSLGAFGRLGLLFNGRLFNWFAFDAGVAATLGYADTGSVHLGLLLRPSFVLPLGEL